MQNQVPKIQNYKSGFFPEFPGPVFSRKKNGGGGQILAHFIAKVKVSCYIYKLKLWHDVADVKSVEN